MTNYFGYLWYVAKHKYYVAIECFKVGLVWRGIVHDCSKFLPSELIPYARHFWGKGKNINDGRDKTGYYKPTDTGDPAFDFAWLLHQKRNRHHWQFWILPEDSGGVKILEMEKKYLLEMLCDWNGAAKAQGHYQEDHCKRWYLANKNKMQLNQKTKEHIEKGFGL